MSLRKNLLSNFVLTAATMLFPFITFPYITRVFPPATIGNYTFVDAFTQYFLIFSAIGIPVYGIREVAKVKDDPAAYSKIVTELMIIQISLSCCFSLVFFVLYCLIPQLHSNPDLVKLGCLFLFSNAFLIEFFYQGIGEFAYITKRSIIVKSLSVIGILVLVKKPDDDVLYRLILVMLPLVNGIINFYNFRRRHYTRFSEPLRIKRHLRPLLIIFGINVSISIYTVFDTIILGFLTDTVNVGLLAAPLRLVKMYWTLVVGASVVIIPKVSVYFADNDFKKIRELLSASCNLVFLLCVPFCVFCLVFPEEIIFIIAGDKYIAAAGAMRVLSVVPLIVGVCNVFGSQFLMPMGKEKKILHATIAGLIVSLAANFALVPHLQFMGSAIACVLAESTVCIYVFVAARKQLKPEVDTTIVLHVLISAAICIVVSMCLRGHLNSVTLLAVAVALYTFFFVVLQIIWFRNTFIFSLVNFKRT